MRGQAVGDQAAGFDLAASARSPLCLVSLCVWPSFVEAYPMFDTTTLKQAIELISERLGKAQEYL